MSARSKYEYHLAHWSDIQDHLPRLYEAARGNCLEIGVRSGVSTSALLAGVEERGEYLFSVDINDCRVFEGHPKWLFIKSDSGPLGAPYVKQFIPEQFDVLFVDGDHTYDGALWDLTCYGPMAKRIFVHDTDAPDFPDVRKAVEEFVQQTKRKVTYHSGSYGMAEIQ